MPTNEHRVVIWVTPEDTEQSREFKLDEVSVLIEEGYECRREDQPQGTRYTLTRCYATGDP